MLIKKHHSLAAVLFYIIPAVTVQMFQAVELFEILGSFEKKTT
jgi:hypothetical protein